MLVQSGQRELSWKGRGALLAALCGVLSGCAVTPRPLDSAEREQLAAETRKRMFEGQEALDGPLTLPQATARAIKYQSEHRQRRMEEAAAAAQLDVAQFDLLPKLTANAGYTSRNNDAFGFGFTPEGTIATSPTASVERRHSTASLGWRGTSWTSASAISRRASSRTRSSSPR